MSFRKATAGVPPVILSLLLSGGFAWGGEPDPRLAPSQTTCHEADMHGVPTPAGVDCTEYQFRLEQQAKRMDILAKIQAAKEQITGQKALKETLKPELPAQQASLSPPPLADRVIEVFGDQALIRYHGNVFTVRQGQRLPQGTLIGTVNLDGVSLVEGENRRFLPFYIGGEGR